MTNECKDLYEQGDMKSAYEVCTQLVQDMDETSADYQWSQLILFDLAHHRGQQDEAYQRLVSLLELELSSDIRYELLRRQGNYYRTKKSYMYAKGYYQEALNIAQQQNNQVKLAKSYNDLGLIYLKEKQYQSSIEFLKKSLDIKYQLGNQALIRTTLTNLGLLYYKTGDYQDAIELYQEAEAILSNPETADAKSQYKMIHLHSYFVAAYNKWGKTEMAESYLSLFQSQLAQIESKQEILNRYLNLVELLVDGDSFALARRVLSHINLELIQEDDNNAQLFYYMALVEYQFDNYDVAKTYALKSQSQMNLHKTHVYQQDLYLLLSQIEDSLENSRQAYNWFQKYHFSQLADIQKQVDQDFKYLKYEQSLENNRINLVKVELNNAILEKKNYQYLMVLLVLLVVLFLLVLIFYYHRKILANNNLLLNKDIEKHKAICEILENQPISFKHLFKNKAFPIVVLDKNNKLLYANFTLDEKSKQRLVTTFNSPDTSAILQIGLHPEEKIPITFDHTSHEPLKDYSHINVQKVLSASYIICSFCNLDTKLDLSKEVNAITQFEFYLKQHQEFDHQQTRKIIVDCMNLCLAIWKRATSSNRIEFADQSGAWKINVDDGRLRTRSLDRYFSLKTIPKNPRIMQVIKSCQFILALNQINNQDRTRLSFYLEKLQDLA